MALAHFWMQNLSRTTPSLPAAVAVHYLKREAEFAPEASVFGTSEQTKASADLRAWGTQNLPVWAGPDGAGKFFHAAEQYEGVNRYHAVMLQFSLPREMTHEQHIALTKDFIEATMHDKPLLWVKHEPLDKLMHEPQPHIHILLSARTVDGIERDAAHTFRRWNRDEPSRGGCEKDLFWSRRQAVEQLRMSFTDLTNMHAEELGLDMRIDSRSLRRRDIDRKPMYTEADRPTRETLAAEQRKATAAWEQRKASKGLSDIQAIPREELVLLVRQWTRDYTRGTALPRATAKEVATYQARRQAQLQEERARLDEALAQSEAHEETLDRAERGEQVPMRQLVAAMAAADERIQHAQWRVRLWEEQGYGH